MYLEDVNRKSLTKVRGSDTFSKIRFCAFAFIDCKTRYYDPPKNVPNKNQYRFLNMQNFVVISNSLMPPSKRLGLK
jgi:hypothetical protein